MDHSLFCTSDLTHILLSFRSCHWTPLYRWSLSKTLVLNLTCASHNKKEMPSNRKWCPCTNNCSLPMRRWVSRTGVSVIARRWRHFSFLSLPVSTYQLLEVSVVSAGHQQGRLVWAGISGLMEAEHHTLTEENQQLKRQMNELSSELQTSKEQVRRCLLNSSRRRRMCAII